MTLYVNCVVVVDNFYWYLTTWVINFYKSMVFHKLISDFLMIIHDDILFIVIYFYKNVVIFFIFGTNKISWTQN
jgi:hypothetical protein